MIELFHQKQSRREFLRGLGRYFIPGGLVSTAGTLIVKRKLVSAEGESVDISICQSCTFLRKCDHPRALLAREEMAR